MGKTWPVLVLNFYIVLDWLPNSVLCISPWFRQLSAQTGSLCPDSPLSAAALCGFTTSDRLSQKWTVAEWRWAAGLDLLPAGTVVVWEEKSAWGWLRRFLGVLPHAPWNLLFPRLSSSKTPRCAGDAEQEECASPRDLWKRKPPCKHRRGYFEESLKY